MVRIFQHYLSKSVTLLAITEILILFAVPLVGVELYVDADRSLHAAQGLLPKAFVFAGVMFVAMLATGLYWDAIQEGLAGKLLRITLGLLSGIMGLLLLFHLFPDVSFDAAILPGLIGSGFLGILLVRGIYYLLVDRGALRRPLLVLGAGEKAHQLDGLDWRDVNLVGYIPIQGQRHQVDSRKLVLTTQSLYATARDYQVEEIVVALDERRNTLPIAELLECKMKGIKVIDSTRFCEAHTGKVSINDTNASILIYAEGFHRSKFSACSKRLVDIGVSLLLLPLLSPLMLVTALAILVTSPDHAPVLYRQVRVGKAGAPFKILRGCLKSDLHGSFCSFL